MSTVNHDIRIIGGQWKRTRLRVLDMPGLRPTPDRVRETLFNWLGQDLTGWRCLDAFAGTGALGLEAASRGAAEVLWVEPNKALAAQLQKTVTPLRPAADPAPRLQVQLGDGVQALTSARGLDLVFLDPPFDGPWFEPALRAAQAAVREGGWVYLEAPRAWAESELAALGLSLRRHLKAGQVHAHLLQRSKT
ncbi:MAG: Ribosomal small subunit methyltransferase [Pseudomonadota bacterium]|jgi:16S rRNA (guanine966-N2)-methyltransferase